MKRQATNLKANIMTSKASVTNAMGQRVRILGLIRSVQAVIKTSMLTSLEAKNVLNAMILRHGSLQYITILKNQNSSLQASTKKLNAPNAIKTINSRAQQQYAANVIRMSIKTSFSPENAMNAISQKAGSLLSMTMKKIKSLSLQASTRMFYAQSATGKGCIRI